MDFIETPDRQRISIQGSTKREKDYLREKFPGAVIGENGFTIPASIPIVYNIYSRLKKRFKDCRVTPFVREILQSDFKLLEIPDGFQFFTEPQEHQMIALRYLYTQRGGGLLLDPGLGKTKVALDYIALLNSGRSLVVCPAALLFVWEDEVAIHRPDKTIHVVTTTDWEEEVKRGLLEKDIVVINYEKAVILQEQLAKTCWGSIFVDEALIKNPTSQRTKALLYIRSRIPVRVIMSGTLVTQSHLDVYAPLKFLMPELVGLSFAKFRDTYVNRFTITKQDGRKVTLSGNPIHVEEVRSILESCCIVMSKKWIKLPEKKWFPVQVQMGDLQREKYYELTRNYITEVGGDYVEADSPLTLLGKLLQISNGFLYVKEDSPLDELLEDAKPSKRKRKTFYFQDQPKIEWLRKSLQGFLRDRKIVLWFNMEAEFHLLETLMKDIGIPYVSVKGGKKNTGELIRGFNKDPEIKVLLAQARAINYGATLLGKRQPDETPEDKDRFNYLSDSVFTHIFYSRNFSLEIFLQQQDRSHRIGLKVSPEYYVLASNSPVEAKIDEALMNKQVLKDMVLVDIINELKNAELR